MRGRNRQGLRTLSPDLIETSDKTATQVFRLMLTFPPRLSFQFHWRTIRPAAAAGAVGQDGSVGRDGFPFLRGEPWQRFVCV